MKISQLPNSEAVTSDDLFVMVDDPDGPNPSTKKVSAASVRDTLLSEPANLQINSGTLSEILSYLPLQAEPVWATDAKQLFIGDGTTYGGIPVGSAKVVKHYDFPNVYVEGEVPQPDPDLILELGQAGLYEVDLYLNFYDLDGNFQGVLVETLLSGGITVWSGYAHSHSTSSNNSGNKYFNYINFSHGTSEGLIYIQQEYQYISTYHAHLILEGGALDTVTPTWSSATISGIAHRTHGIVTAKRLS
jgi:hypothetical protein